MIIDNLKNINYYFQLSPMIKEALSFIKTNLFIFKEKLYDINAYMFAVVETSLPEPIVKLRSTKNILIYNYVIEGYDIL